MNKWFAGCDNVKLFELHKKVGTSPVVSHTQCNSKPILVRKDFPLGVYTWHWCIVTSFLYGGDMRTCLRTLAPIMSKLLHVLDASIETEAPGSHRQHFQHHTRILLPHSSLSEMSQDSRQDKRRQEILGWVQINYLTSGEAGTIVCTLTQQLTGITHQHHPDTLTLIGQM